MEVLGQVAVASTAVRGKFLYWHLGLGRGVLTDFRARSVDFARGALLLADRRGRLLTVPLIHSIDELRTARATPPVERVPETLPFVCARAVDTSTNTSNLTLLCEEEGDERLEFLLPPLFLSTVDSEGLYQMFD